LALVMMLLPPCLLGPNSGNRRMLNQIIGEEHFSLVIATKFCFQKWWLCRLARYLVGNPTQPSKYEPLNQKMSDKWYDLVDPSAPLTQGDLIFDCPVLTWEPDALIANGNTFETEVLQNAVSVVSMDVIVMTQACDLEQNRVKNVILSPHVSLEEHQAAWREEMRAHSQNPTEKAWKAHCDDICKGFIFNYTMLNRCQIGESHIGVRIVYFHELYTLPQSFLESLLLSRGRPRFRLLSPYREHLSQSFARFFMRVGLPTPVESPWRT